MPLFDYPVLARVRYEPADDDPSRGRRPVRCSPSTRGDPADVSRSAGIGYERIHYDHDQAVPNDIEMEAAPLLRLGVEARLGRPRAMIGPEPRSVSHETDHPLESPPVVCARGGGDVGRDSVRAGRAAVEP